MNKQKGIIPILIALVVVVVLAGGYLIYQNQTKPTSVPLSTTRPFPGPVDETANWKIYINNKRDYQFKYPDSYKLNITEASSTTLESVYLEKDTEYTVGGGMSGSDVLKKGVVISFTVFPNKDLSEAALKSEYGIYTNIKIITVDSKEGVEIQSQSYSGRIIYVKHNTIVLEISSNHGFESSKPDQEVYLADFNKIFSTFKFQ